MSLDEGFKNPFTVGIASMELESWKKMEDDWAEKMGRDIQSTLTLAAGLLFTHEVLRNNPGRYRFLGMRSVLITLMNGRRIRVNSPAYQHIPIKRRGRPRKVNKGALIHPALEFLGFIDKKSPEFLSAVVRSAVSSSSFQAASEDLAFHRIPVSHEQVRNLTYRYADLFLAERVKNCLDGSEKQANLRIEITIDGGRIRMREEVKKKNGVRQNTTFKPQWREPILFSIRIINEKGELVREVPQLLEGTMKNWKNAFALLTKYLQEYNLKDAKQITFLADGSNSIWSHVDTMMENLGVIDYSAVVDHMHAKQNLNIIIAMMNKKLSKAAGVKNHDRMHALLWEGEIDGMKDEINNHFNSKRRGKKAALNKLNNYFGHHERFEYERLRKEGHPIGSGSIESAIRRAINMKLKGNGIFWNSNNCEKMLYLRCQFLTKRWDILKDKLEQRRLSCYGINNLGELMDEA